jgi:hypothetical protein
MELAIDDPNLRAKEYADKASGYKSIQGAPLAQQGPGVGEQMADMAKQRAMKGALDAGQTGITSALTSSAPVVASGVEGGAILGAGAGTGAMASVGTAMPYVGAAMLADKALGLGIMDSFFSEGGEVGPLSPQYHAGGGMSAEDYRYQMPGGDVYNARMERNKVKQAERESMPIMKNKDGSINQQYYNMQEGIRQLQKQQDFVYPQVIPDNGKKMGALRMAYTDDPIAQKMYGVGNAPIDTSLMPLGFIGHPTDNQGYTARGYDQGGEVMSEEQARALMNNQPEPTPMPMMRPDPRELMAEIKQEMAMPQPRSRPASINPYDAAMNYEGYDPILPAPTDLPQYRAGGGPLGMGVLGMYHDMMKKNMG